jgi:cobalamin biosynthesis Mg chelatase CobN
MAEDRKQIDEQWAKVESALNLAIKENEQRASRRRLVYVLVDLVLTADQSRRQRAVLLLVAAALFGGLIALSLQLNYTTDNSPSRNASQPPRHVPVQPRPRSSQGQSSQLTNNHQSPASQEYADAPPTVNGSGPQNSAAATAPEQSPKAVPGAAFGSTRTALAQTENESDRADASSPLVPILIAIMLLAISSVAYVLVRQRRGRRRESANGRVRYR